MGEMKVTPKDLSNDSERMYMMPAAARGTRAYNPFPFGAGLFGGAVGGIASGSPVVLAIVTAVGTDGEA